MTDSLELWNAEADAFDNAPDHGLLNDAIRLRWRMLLDSLLPRSGRVLDLGCGTGSLSLLMAEAGYEVVGIDFSPRMIEIARRKAADSGTAIDFRVGDAGAPDFPACSFDVLLCRHVVWMFEPPEATLKVWSRLLRNGGSMVLIEGFWSTGAGLRCSELVAALPPELVLVRTQNLSSDEELWGRSVSDERYAVRADRYAMTA